MGNDRKLQSVVAKIAGAAVTRREEVKSASVGWEEEAVSAKMVRLGIAKVTGMVAGVSTVVESSKVQSEGKCKLLSSGCDTPSLQRSQR